MPIHLSLFCLLRELQNPREQLPLHGVPTSAWHRCNIWICRVLLSIIAIGFDWLFGIISIDFSRKKRNYNVTYKVWQIIWHTAYVFFNVYFCGGPFLWRPLGTCPVCLVLNPAPKRPDMQFNTPGTLHCGKLSLNRDRLPTGTRRSWLCRFKQAVNITAFGQGITFSSTIPFSRFSVEMSLLAQFPNDVTKTHEYWSVIHPGACRTNSLSLSSLLHWFQGVRVATRLCRPVDDPPPLSSILGRHPPVHVLQLRLSHVPLDAIAPSHMWFPLFLFHLSWWTYVVLGRRSSVG